MFRDEEWPEPEDHATEENQKDADNQINLSLPGDQEGLEEQEESDVLVTSLAYTSVNDDTAELSEDDCDVVGDDHGTGKKGGLTTANYHTNSPGVPPTTNLQDESNSADIDLHQRAEKDSKLTEMKKNQQDGDILQAKIAKSVGKRLGTTPLVKTFDKARRALHE